MVRRLGLSILLSAMPWVTHTLVAQTATVATTITFVVPVNLTQLSPDLEKVRVACVIQPSSALVWPTSQTGPAPTLEEAMDVKSGQVVTAFRIIMPILSSWLQDPIGKRADYSCALEGYSKGRWDRFSETASDSAWRLTPTPQSIYGSFTW